MVTADLSYQRYLESVLESVEEFGEVKDIIARFDTLAATNAELMERAREAQEKTERDRAVFLHETEVSGSVVLKERVKTGKMTSRFVFSYAESTNPKNRKKTTSY